MRYVNLTPHAVTIINGDGDIVLTVQTSGTIARLPEHITPAGDLDGVQVMDVILDVTDIPEPQDGVIYIGSMPLLMGLAAVGIHRQDLVYPYGQIRDAAGRIIGCRSFARIAA